VKENTKEKTWQHTPSTNCSTHLLCCVVLCCAAVVYGSFAVWHDSDHPDHLGRGDDTPDRVWWHCGQEQQAGLCSTMQVRVAELDHLGNAMHC
jgi:hypothetical protein